VTAVDSLFMVKSDCMLDIIVFVGRGALEPGSFPILCRWNREGPGWITIASEDHAPWLVPRPALLIEAEALWFSEVRVLVGALDQKRLLFQ
jgi:hypothetical protein